MAIYRLSISIISRGSGKSSVASSAYRAGEKIKNEYDGITHDYTRKRGIVHTEILLPDNAPSEFADRATLWNAVEKIEKSKNSQLAREITIALPIELTQSQNINLVREYVQANFVDRGMCADVAIHDTDGSNPHAHIMLTMRPFNEDKSWGAKQRKEYILDQQGQKIYDPKKRQYKCKSIQTTDWDEQTKAEEWREAWAEVQNRYLEKYHDLLHPNNEPVRVDHRSYERQELEIIPSIHLGVAAHQMEQKGIRTERGDINREIEIGNRKIRQYDGEILRLQDEISNLQTQLSSLEAQTPKLHDEIFEVHGWLEEEKANLQPPTFADFISDVLLQQAQSFVGLKFATQIVDFLNSKKIDSYEGVERYLKNLISEKHTITHKLNPIRQRLSQTAKDMRAYEDYKKHKDNYDKYKSDFASQKPWKKKAFEREHGWVVGVYESAKENTDHLRNKDDKFPTGSWRKQRTNLATEANNLNARYQALKVEFDDVNKIRSKVYDVLRKERQKERVQPARSQGMEI